MIVNDDSPYPANGLKARAGSEKNNANTFGRSISQTPIARMERRGSPTPTATLGPLRLPTQTPWPHIRFSLTYGEGTVARDSACSPIRISSPPLSIRLKPYGYGRVDCKRGGILHRNDLTTKAKNPLRGKITVRRFRLQHDVDDWGLLLPPEIVDMVEMGYLNGPRRNRKCF